MDAETSFGAIFFSIWWENLLEKIDKVLEIFC